MTATGNLLVFCGLLAGLLGVTACWVRARRKAAARDFIAQAFHPPAQDGLHGASDIPTIEAAERQLGLIYRRLRAYLRDPYDFAASRIKDEDDFEHCLDLAASLNIRIGDLGGAAPGGPDARDQVREQVLEGLVEREFRQRR